MLEEKKIDEAINSLVLEFDMTATECSCGSSKRPEKCCGPIQPRTYAAKLDPRNYLESDGFAIGTDLALKRTVNGKLKPIIGSPELSQSYKRKRKGGNKVIVKGVARGDHVFDPESLLIGFDHIFAIDTNTKSLGEDSISVSGVVHGFLSFEEDQVRLNYTPIFLLEFWNAQTKPERLGWYALISAIERNPDFAEKKVGIIVDSELGELDGLNERRSPLDEAYFLPTGFELIYATGDVASNATNKLIRLCDRLASLKLDEVIGDPRLETLNDTTYPCDRFRQWTP